MSEIIVAEFLSLDGVVQGPGGPDEDRSGGFDLGGWLVPYADEDMGRQVVRAMEKAGGFLLGRVTYEIFAAHWPRVTDPDDPVAAKLNGSPKFVASRTLTSARWQGTTVVQDVVARVEEFRRTPGEEIQVHGSGDLVHTLMEHDLVDEYRLWTYPVVLGTGKRLFHEGAPPVAMRLAHSETTAAGVVMNTYRRAGEIQLGSFALDRSTENSNA